MAEIIEARVWQKVDTEANWLANPLPLGSGEQAFVSDKNNFKVNTFKTKKTFAELEYYYKGDIIGGVLPTDDLASKPDGVYRTTISGTYSSIVVKEGYYTLLRKDNGVWKLESEVKMPEYDDTVLQSRITTLQQAKLDKSLIEDVIKLPNKVYTNFFLGYWHSSGSKIDQSASTTPSLTTEYISAIEGDIINLSGYMRRDTSVASGIKIQFRKSDNTIISDIDLKGTDTYRVIAPAQTAKYNVVVAYNFDGNQDLTPYYTSFKIIKGDILETIVITPELNVSPQNVHLYDTKTRELAYRNNQLETSVKSLRKLKSENSGEIEITINNKLGVEIENAVAIVQLHWGEKSSYNQFTNDYYMNRLCNKDFSDIRFLDNDGNFLDSIKESFGDYEILADNRSRWQMCTTSDGVLFGSDITGGVYKSENSMTSWLQVTTEGVVTGVNKNNDLLYYKNNNVYLRKKTENYATEYLSFQGNQDVTGEILYNPVTFAMDDLGNLYLSPYQGNWDAKIYKSTDNGETWSLVHQNEKQHCHSIVLDKSVIPNIIYANFDGDAVNHGLPTSAGTYKSSDRGATWELIEMPFSPDYGVVWSKNGKTLGGGESQLKPTPMLFKIENDRITTILDEQSNISGMRELNGNLYLPVLTVDQYKYSKIFRSTDNGETWNVILDTGYRHLDALSGSWRYGMQTNVTPIGDENQLIMQYSSSRSAGFPAIRIKEGGEHYQAMYYVKLGNVPAEGKTIKIGYGYLMEDVQADVFTEQKLDSEVYSFPLNELGDYISDDFGNTYKLNNSEWDWKKDVVRFGKTYPHKLPMKNNGAVKLNQQVLLPDLAEMRKSRDFSFSFWIRTEGLKKDIPILENDIISFNFALDARINAKYGSTTKLLNNVIKRHNSQQYCNIVVTISNSSSKPIMNCYSNTYKTEGRSVELTSLPNTTPLQAWKLGGFNSAFISDFKFYNKELTHNEVIQLYEGGRVINI